MLPKGGVTCNKCKVGEPSEGDSWCIGCSGLDLAQELLKLRWRQPGVRKVAEETILTAARLVRAFANLDQSLGGGPAGSGLAGDRREAGRKSVPPPPPAPDRQSRHHERSRSRRRRNERSPIRRTRRTQELHPKVRAQPPAGGAGEDEYMEESEEEEAREEDCAREPAVAEVKQEADHRRPSEPAYPPPHHSSPRRSRKKKKKKKTRGWKKHQKHYREATEPFRRSHRKLKGNILELASSARAGLERMIWRGWKPPSQVEGMSFPPEPPIPVWDGLDPPPDFPSPDDIRERLRRQPKPTEVTTYNLAEAAFWRHWHVPAGSVIQFTGGFIEESSNAECAVLIKQRESTEEGIWLTVKALGCSDKAFQKEFTHFFQRGKRKIHLCYGDAKQCPFLLDECLHIDQFTWFPAGEFAAK